MFKDRVNALWRDNKGFVLFLGLMFVFRSAVADWNHVPSSSMNPSLVAGDRVLVNKLAYSLRLPFTLQHLVRWDQPHRGDVITFDSPAEDVNLIKRVVAVPGDVVAMRDNQLVLNGHPVPRDLVAARREIPTESGMLSAEVWREQLDGRSFEVARLPELNHLTAFGPVTVPEGHVLVLGDSRDNSKDSRYLGFIDMQRITGRAVRVVLSHDLAACYLPRGDRWWKPLNG